MQISKTDFLHYLNCPKSFWLLKHKPDVYPHGVFSAYAAKIAAEGYEVKAYVQSLLGAQANGDRYLFQSVFETERGLYARADVTRDNRDGTTTLYEIKSSTSVKRGAQHNHIKDAAFQMIAAEDAGASIAKVFIIHLNGAYIRHGPIDPAALLTFADVSDEVRGIEEETRCEIDTALAFLSEETIDERSCSCLMLTKSNHCDAFDHFNPEIPQPSIYDLPRISKSKLATFVTNGRFGLDDVSPDEVSANQARVLTAAQSGEPLIDHAVLIDFYARAQYPLYFLDYETYNSAIPLVDGAQPQAPIPFQFSLHVKRTPDDDELRHFGYLAEDAALPLALIEQLQEHIGPTGSVVSWHAAFENTQNRNMTSLYPDKAEFLRGLIDRTLDLEDLFKAGYVDIAFGGSTSIKKVLPVLVPDLTYEGMAVANGTDAMEAWIRLINLPDGTERDALRQAMLDYCKLDSLAMVMIFDRMQPIAAA